MNDSMLAAEHVHQMCTLVSGTTHTVWLVNNYLISLISVSLYVKMSIIFPFNIGANEKYIDTFLGTDMQHINKCLYM